MHVDLRGDFSGAAVTSCIVNLQLHRNTQPPSLPLIVCVERTEERAGQLGSGAEACLVSEYSQSCFLHFCFPWMVIRIFSFLCWLCFRFMRLWDGDVDFALRHLVLGEPACAWSYFEAEKRLSSLFCRIQLASCIPLSLLADVPSFCRCSFLAIFYFVFLNSWQNSLCNSCCRSIYVHMWAC